MEALSEKEKQVLEKSRVQVTDFIDSYQSERVFKGVKKGLHGTEIKVQIRIASSNSSELKEDYTFMNDFTDRRVLIYHLYLEDIQALVTDSTLSGTLDHFLTTQTSLSIPNSVIRWAKQLREGLQFLSDKQVFARFTTRDIFLTESLDLKLGNFRTLKCTQEDSLQAFGKLLIQLETFGQQYESTRAMTDFKNFFWNSSDPSYKQLATLLVEQPGHRIFRKDPYQIVGAALEGVSKIFSLVPKPKPLYQRLRDVDHNNRLQSIVKSHSEVEAAWRAVITALEPPKPKKQEFHYQSRESEFEQIRKATELSLSDTSGQKKLSESQELKRVMELSMMEDAPYQLTEKDLTTTVPSLQELMGHETPIGKIIFALEKTRGDMDAAVEKLFDPSFEWTPPKQEQPKVEETKPQPEVEFDLEDIAFLGLDGVTEAKEKQQAVQATGKLRQVLLKNLKDGAWHEKKPALESIEYTQSVDPKMLPLIISIATDDTEDELLRTVAKDTLEKFAPLIDQIVRSVDPNNNN